MYAKGVESARIFFARFRAELRFEALRVVADESGFMKALRVVWALMNPALATCEATKFFPLTGR